MTVRNLQGLGAGPSVSVRPKESKYGQTCRITEALVSRAFGRAQGKCCRTRTTRSGTWARVSRRCCYCLCLASSRPPFVRPLQAQVTRGPSRGPVPVRLSPCWNLSHDDMASAFLRVCTDGMYRLHSAHLLRCARANADLCVSFQMSQVAGAAPTRLDPVHTTLAARLLTRARTTRRSEYHLAQRTPSRCVVVVVLVVVVAAELEYLST
jgi:hypothetical protein